MGPAGGAPVHNFTQGSMMLLRQSCPQSLHRREPLSTQHYFQIIPLKSITTQILGKYTCHSRPYPSILHNNDIYCTYSTRFSFLANARTATYRVHVWPVASMNLVLKAESTAGNVYLTSEPGTRFVHLHSAAPVV